MTRIDTEAPTMSDAATPVAQPDIDAQPPGASGTGQPRSSAPFIGLMGPSESSLLETTIACDVIGCGAAAISIPAIVVPALAPPLYDTACCMAHTVPPPDSVS